MAKELSAPEVLDILREIYGPVNGHAETTERAQWVTATVVQINRWLVRGDKVAVYRNEDLGHPELGHMQILSYGSPAAQLETTEPPTNLPDIGNRINWRYQLHATYGEHAIEDVPAEDATETPEGSK